MAIINSEEIKNTLDYLLTIYNILDKESETIRGNKSNLDKVVPSDIQKIYSVKQKDTLSFLDSINIIFYEGAFMSLVAQFEKISIAKHKTTQGEIRKAVTEIDPPLAFYKSREKYILDPEKDNLGQIMFLMDGHIDKELYAKLKIIKEQRDYYAHGKRFDKDTTTNYSLSEVAEILDKALVSIS